MSKIKDKIKVQRVQTGIRMEKNMVKTLKGLAEYFEITLGDLLEGIVLHAFEGKSPFNGESLGKIEEFKKIYSMNYDASASHNFIEEDE